MSTVERGYSLPVDHFTVVPNSWARDRQLSRRARGLLIELMSHRAGWRTSVDALSERGPEGAAAIKTAIKELEKFGYLEREFETDARGRRTGIRYIIVDPASKENSSSEPSGENHPMDDEPSVENHPMDTDETAGHPSVDFPPAANHPPKKNTLQEEHSLKDLQEEKNRCRVVDGTHDRASEPNNAAAATSDEIRTETERLRAEFDQTSAEFEKHAAAAERTDIALKVENLERAARDVRLTASFHKLTDEHRSEIATLIDLHGIPALVKAAQRQHRPDSPARFAQAWLPAWRELRAATTQQAVGQATRSEKQECTQCDEFGWLLGDLSAPIDPPTRCTHGRNAVA